MSERQRFPGLTLPCCLCNRNSPTYAGNGTNATQSLMTYLNRECVWGTWGVGACSEGRGSKVEGRGAKWFNHVLQRID